MKLYKYVTSERTDVLENQEIRFSQPGSLNDPFELRPHILVQRENLDPDEVVRSNVLDEQLREAYKSLASVFPAAYSSFEEFKSDFERQIDAAKSLVVANNKFKGPGPDRSEFAESVIDFFDERFGILSLTKTPKNFLMWSHYSEEHRGFVIQLDTESNFFNGERRGISEPVKVSYSNKRPAVYWEPSGLTEEQLNYHYIDNFLTTESKEWGYEEEWRVIKRLDRSDRTLEEDCDWDVPIELFEFPADAISGIVFGVRTSDKIKRNITDLVSNPPYEHVDVAVAEIHESEYRIVVNW